MNYEKLSLEELEERFTEQFNHHFVLTEAVRNSSEALTQIMKADTGESCPLEQRLHVAISRIGIDGIFRLHRVRKDPLADGIRFSPP